VGLTTRVARGEDDRAHQPRTSGPTLGQLDDADVGSITAGGAVRSADTRDDSGR
jgi:hypothetical protein